jgi:N-methylhydantoinase B
MRGKKKKFMPHGKKIMIAFPTGAGFGCIFERRAAVILGDLAGGHITAQTAEALCGLAPK